MITQPDERIDKVNCDVSIIQKKHGLTFTTDAYLLASFIDKQSKTAAVELGAGTGIVSLLCLDRDKFSHITALEIQPEFASLARRNAELNRMTDRLDVTEGDVRHIEDFLPGLGTYGAVFSNPPYMPENSGKHNDADMLTIAKREINGGIFDFCHAASRLLRTGGSFYCVYLPSRLAELMRAASECCIEPKRLTLVFADSRSKPSLALLKCKRGASPSLEITRPLILYEDGSREYTPMTQTIYDTCSFEHIFQ